MDSLVRLCNGKSDGCKVVEGIAETSPGTHCGSRAGLRSGYSVWSYCELGCSMEEQVNSPIVSCMVDLCNSTQTSSSMGLVTTLHLVVCSGDRRGLFRWVLSCSL